MDLRILLPENWPKGQASTELVSKAFISLLNESIHMPEHPLYIGIVANGISLIVYDTMVLCSFLSHYYLWSDIMYEYGLPPLAAKCWLQLPEVTLGASWSLQPSLKRLANNLLRNYWLVHGWLS